MTEAERTPSPHARFVAIAVLVALLMWLCSCEKKPEHQCPLEEEIEAIRNTNYAKTYHIHQLYARIDSMQNRLMYLEDSIEFNTPGNLYGQETVWIRPYPEPKDSAYGVSHYQNQLKCSFWVDNKRHAIYKVAIGDSLYYVTRVKHK